MEKKILNWDFLYDYDLLLRADSFKLLPENDARISSIDLVDKIVEAQREEVRKCRVLAEKEEELFPENVYHYNRDEFAEESERLRKDEIMRHIQTLLLDFDINSGDKWFVERYNECIQNAGKIHNSEANLPEEHTIWDTLLPSLAAEQLKKTPCQYMVSPIYKGIAFRPQVRMLGEQILVSFCMSTNKPQRNILSDDLSLCSILLQKREGTLEVLGGYEFPIDESYFDYSFAKIREGHYTTMEFDYMNEMVEPEIWNVQEPVFKNNGDDELPF